MEVIVPSVFVLHISIIMFLVSHFGIPFATFHYFLIDFLWGLKTLQERAHEVIFLFGLKIRFLILSSIDPGNILFHFHSSLHCKIVSFSPYSDWIKRESVAILRNLTATGKQFGGILAAHSISTTLKYWYHGSPPGEIVSLGVLSEGKPKFFVSCNI